MKTLKLTASIMDLVTIDYSFTQVLRESCCNAVANTNLKPENTFNKSSGTLEQPKSALNEIAELNNALSKKFINWTVEEIIDYITSTHNPEAKEKAIAIFDTVEEVLYHHYTEHPELVELSTVLFLFLQDLLTHFKNEEQILFRKIKQLIEKQRRFKIDLSANEFLKTQLIKLHKEHFTVCGNLELLRKLTGNYLLPPDACSTYKQLFEIMQAFENNLFLLVLLEVNVLFPRVIASLDNIDNIQRLN